MVKRRRHFLFVIRIAIRSRRRLGPAGNTRFAANELLAPVLYSIVPRVA
jgi:hypothetical protein